MIEVDVLGGSTWHDISDACGGEVGIRMRRPKKKSLFLTALLSHAGLATQARTMRPGLAQFGKRRGLTCSSGSQV